MITILKHFYNIHFLILIKSSSLKPAIAYKLIRQMHTNVCIYSLKLVLELRPIDNSQIPLTFGCSVKYSGNHSDTLPYLTTNQRKGLIRK